MQMLANGFMFPPAFGGAHSFLRLSQNECRGNSIQHKQSKTAVTPRFLLISLLSPYFAQYLQ